MKQVIINFLLMIGAFVIFTPFKVFGFVINTVRYIFWSNPSEKRTARLARYFYNNAVGIDQTAGSFVYGTEDWTISSWTYYLGVIKEKTAAKMFMFFIDIGAYLLSFGKQKTHCKTSYINEKEELRKQADCK